MMGDVKLKALAYCDKGFKEYAEIRKDYGDNVRFINPYFLTVGDIRVEKNISGVILVEGVEINSEIEAVYRKAGMTEILVYGKKKSVSKKEEVSEKGKEVDGGEEKPKRVRRRRTKVDSGTD